MKIERHKTKLYLQVTHTLYRKLIVETIGRTVTEELIPTNLFFLNALLVWYKRRYIFISLNCTQSVIYIHIMNVYDTKKSVQSENPVHFYSTWVT